MSLETLNKLQQQADELQDSPAKVAVLDEAIRIADRLGEKDQQLLLRFQLIMAAYESGQEEKAFVAFSWCVSHSDQIQDELYQEMFLLSYTLLLMLAPGFYTLSLETIRAMQEDFKRRLEMTGLSLLPYYRAMASNAEDLGLGEERKRYAALWRTARPFPLLCCKAGERWSRINDCLLDGEYSKALISARPILQGKIANRSVRLRTHSILLRAALQRGDMKRADEFFAAGYPPVAQDLDSLWSIGSHLCYLTRVADIAQGARLIERNLPGVIQRSIPWLTMKYFSLIADFFERAGDLRPQTRKVRLPKSLSIHTESGRYTPAKLVQWFRDEAYEIARKFDQRNNNSHVSWILAEDRAIGLGLPIPEYPNAPQPAGAVSIKADGQRTRRKTTLERTHEPRRTG